MRKRFALVGLAAMVVLVGSPGAVTAHEGEDHDGEDHGEAMEEDFEDKFYGASVCFDRAAKITIEGHFVGTSVERPDGTVVEKGTFEATFSQVVLHEETGKPEKDSEDNATGELTGSFKDVFENNEQNDEGDYTGPVTSYFQSEGTGTSAGGLTLEFFWEGTEEIGEGGFDDGKLLASTESFTCTAE